MTDLEQGPLDAAWVADKRISVDELDSAEGALWWLQSDSAHAGVTRLMRWTSATGAHAATPPSLPVGGWLHAYGGGNYAVDAQGIWVVGAADSKIHHLDQVSGHTRVPAAEDDYLYGDLHAVDGRLLAVRGNDNGDEIIEINPHDHSVRTLVRSPGSLAAPRLHGRGLAYLEWDADRMPWDVSRLLLTEYHSDGELGPGKVLAGGPSESVVEPAWGPDGTLHFLSDRTGWWNLYHWYDEQPTALAPMPQDCASAPWEGGYQSYAFLPGGGIAMTIHHGLRSEVVVLECDSRITRPWPRLTSVKPYLATLGQHLAVIASTPVTAPAVLLADPVTNTEAVRLSSNPTPSPPVSPPQFQTLERDGQQIRYLLHMPQVARPPQSPQQPQESQTVPLPLLVRAHPGPTDDVPQRLDWTVQFFTSRGFAVADVAYRGSTGQGRAFRQALHGHWGSYDVQDCADVAAHLVANDTARPGAVFLTGASAGGYTALQAACGAESPFTAVTATSAIIDPARWTTTAPRFQRPHAKILAGPAGAVRAEEIRLPVLLIHGTADTVAPVQEARDLAAALHERDASHQALFLDGVGHYLSAPESLRRALDAEADFYSHFTDVRRQ
ncbi:S9 family peptidase [Streptacidiphilus sp. P02-A3a]|uniref:alpha/beta hydrolase family protein n=1 Tax=Streptacidiphilus sp. P02-A3a TaxID=2704468 RepID=UPI0015FE1A06|nr:prolyl oligopeptidase family serine peptidase [Streptacidiphilus sp. P02-A3a]QMU67119.1 S9 family peptidase [Streptacidiphilus sp. P02-A3a]